MALHLAEISRTVTPGAHAVLLLDQAGWHLSAKLDVPDNITLMPLPPKCPELNPVENVWQFIRDNWLSNRVFRRSRLSAGFGASKWPNPSTGHTTRNGWRRQDRGRLRRLRVSADRRPQAALFVIGNSGQQI